MKTLRRVTVFGFFAAVGVGLAVCVGMSAVPPPEDESPQAAPVAAHARPAPRRATRAVRGQAARSNGECADRPSRPTSTTWKGRPTVRKRALLRSHGGSIRAHGPRCTAVSALRAGRRLLGRGAGEVPRGVRIPAATPGRGAGAKPAPGVPAAVPPCRGSRRRPPCRRPCRDAGVAARAQARGQAAARP